MQKKRLAIKFYKGQESNDYLILYWQLLLSISPEAIASASGESMAPKSPAPASLLPH